MMTPDPPIKEFIGAFLRDRGLPSKQISFHTLAGDGSTRIFRRIILSQSSPTFIAMENAPASEHLRRENLAYLMIGKHLFQKGLPLPAIHRFDLEKGWFIMEDMGDRSLQDEVSPHKDRISLYQKVLEILFRLQIEGSQGFNTEWCYQTERYDRSVMRHNETDYFRDAFLSNYLGMKKDWPELEGPFDHLAETSSGLDNHHFLHRDFQSRNIMIYDGKMGILDWQGGRLGPLPYDLASLLIDPYTDLSVHEREQIYQIYLLLLKDYQPTWLDPFQRYYPYLAIQRNLQILGAFSYLTKVQGKTYFEAYIPPAVRSLNRLLDELRDSKLSPLKDLLNDLPY
ncbi:MAG: phosphotransferase [Deltaproteobacteria bacterium]|nr:phosphotransferase [Deltaproteobacteria bacterium]